MDIAAQIQHQFGVVALVVGAWAAGLLILVLLVAPRRHK